MPKVDDATHHAILAAESATPLAPRPEQQHPRYAMEAPVEILVERSDRVLTFPLVNISRGGLFLRALETPPPGSRVRLRIRAHGEAIGGAARVVHVVHAQESERKLHPPGMGLAFEPLTPQAGRALERLVASLAEAARASREDRATLELESSSVIVTVHSFPALQTLWAQDLSKGGLFVATQSSPPLGARLTVELRTAGGTLSLRAEVVHVLDAVAARAAGHAPGVGLQLTDLTGANLTALESYATGRAPRLIPPSSTMPPGRWSVRDLQEVIRRLFAGVERGDCHMALGLAQGVSEREERARIASIRTLLAHRPADATPPQLARIQSARKVLLRVEQHLEAWRRSGQGELTRLPEERDPELRREVLTLVQRAAECSRRGELHEARRILAEAQALDANDPEVAHRLATVTAALDRTRALDLLEPADTFVVTGMREQALDHARRALELSQSTEVQTRALRVLFRAGAADEALLLSQELSRKEPRLAVAWEAQMMLHERRGERELAQRAGERLLSLRPNDAKLTAKVKKLRGGLRWLRR